MKQSTMTGLILTNKYETVHKDSIEKLNKENVDASMELCIAFQELQYSVLEMFVSLVVTAP
jgi:hypothetical protein